MESRVVVVGAGAAGLAAAAAAGRGTLVLEKMERPGMKLLISGGGRCNVTSDASAREVVAAFGPGGRFLHNALGVFPPDRIRDWLSEAGVPTHVEMPERKVFPDSGRARDVVEAVVTRVKTAGAEFRLGAPVTALSRNGKGWRLQTPQGEILAGSVILTAGGKSYPKTGTTGDAYAWLSALGHRIVPLRPALSPWTVDLPWVHALSGLTLDDAAVALDVSGSPSERGGFLFTHHGVSGPAPMNLTRWLPRDSSPPYRLLLDPLPDVRDVGLAMQLKKSGLRGLLPARLTGVLSGLLPEKPPAQWSREELSETVRRLKAVPLEPAFPMGFDKAEVTQGGVALDEVDPKTMESKLAPGLYVAGELLDLEGPIGGYNLAAAWATGWAAGLAASG